MFRTKNYKYAALWIFRFIIALDLALLVYLNDYDFITISIIIIFSLFVLGYPVRDIGVSDSHIYFLKFSIIPGLSSRRKIKLKDIKSIQGRGYTNRFWWVFRRHSTAPKYGIQITKKDNSSFSSNISLIKKDMDMILILIRKSIN